MKMADDKWHIRRLDGADSWMTWRVQMKHMLLDRELWKYVTGEEKLDPAAGDTDKAKYKKMKQKALTSIMCSLEPKVVTIVQ